MKKKMIVGFAVLAAAAFPMSALAARPAAQEFACAVEGCRITEEHTHCEEHENCTVTYSDGCYVHRSVQVSRSSCHGGHGCHGRSHHG